MTKLSEEFNNLQGTIISTICRYMPSTIIQNSNQQEIASIIQEGISKLDAIKQYVDQKLPATALERKKESKYLACFESK